MRYAVVIEQGESSFGAYVPDLPGCVAVGKTQDEVRSLITDAVLMHLHSLQEDGGKIPAPQTAVDYVDVPEAA